MPRTHGLNRYETTLTSLVGPTSLDFPVETILGLTSPMYVVLAPNVPSRYEVVLMDGTFSADTLRTTTVNNRYLAGSAEDGPAPGIEHPEGEVVRYSPVQQHVTDLWVALENLESVLAGLELGDLADVDTTGVGEGNFILLESGVWVPVAPALDDLIDVATAGGAEGDVLTLNGAGIYVPQTPSSGGSVLTTKGDLLTHDGDEEVRLPAGTEGQVPTYQPDGSIAPEGPASADLAAHADDLSDITRHAATVTSTSYTTLVNLSGAGHLIGGLLTSTSTDPTRQTRARLTIDGGTPQELITQPGASPPGVLVIPPVRFESSLLVEFRAENPSNGSVIDVWTKLN